MTRAMALRVAKVQRARKRRHADDRGSREARSQFLFCVAAALIALALYFWVIHPWGWL